MKIEARECARAEKSKNKTERNAQSLSYYDDSRRAITQVPLSRRGPRKGGGHLIIARDVDLKLNRRKERSPNPSRDGHIDTLGPFNNRDNKNDKLRERPSGEPYLRAVNTSQIHVASKCPCWHREIDMLSPTINLHIKKFESLSTKRKLSFGFSFLLFCTRYRLRFPAFIEMHI